MRPLRFKREALMVWARTKGTDKALILGDWAVKVSLFSLFAAMLWRAYVQ